ncbi:uncharacterized protein BO95DRAFT_449470 [Aspergillus brunneoviolaceus CBS 621.78]|uniref:Uncharacterized protein n=1 Tax=Aspergillus brunneoviolaceus CBS 621.78 TaxID=1450534 RepID=A0ACD1GNN2_9EURO|nr:hypothetical protein BO95DRAFT_449470 [Aspergillus brunneoviolaceus CBS 621.78]RAH50671.1 hypothetical protein BO95DRAFT_449470 [Aspergillus brunneoviolaceus CBS 621.78]
MCLTMRSLMMLVPMLIAQATALTSMNYDGNLVLPSSGTVLNLAVTASNITYNVTANDTIHTIANKYGVGACDLARLNTLRIPARATFPDDYSCFSTNNTNATSDCIYGGPHVYTILPGDTIQKIANERFNITTESILSFGAQTGYIAALNPGIYDVLQTGETVKIHTCANTACTMTDFTFTYGTLQNFATAYNVTVGQLMSLNLAYMHTDYIAPLGVLYDCSILE